MNIAVTSRKLYQKYIRTFNFDMILRSQLSQTNWDEHGEMPNFFFVLLSIHVPQITIAFIW